MRSAFLAVSLVIAAAACSNQDRGLHRLAVSEPLPKKVVANWSYEGHEFELDIALAGTALEGTIAVFGQSGVQSINPVRLPLEDEGGFPPVQVIEETGDGATLIADGQRLEMIILEREGDTAYATLEVPGVGTVDLRIEGARKARGAAAAAAPIITLPICGSIIVARIFACVASGGCWDFPGSDGICFGSCQPCGGGGGGGGGPRDEVDGGPLETEDPLRP